MLIQIDDSVADYFRNNNVVASAHELIVLKSLIMSYRNGFHIICASADTLDYFASMKLLGTTELDVIEKLISKRATSKAYLKEISRRLIVYKDKCIVDAGDNFTIDLSSLPIQIEKSVLMSENLDDCEFYSSLAKKINKGYSRSFDINLFFDSCGGSQGETTAKNLVEREHRFTVFIMDSDKHSSSDSRGESARKVFSFFDSHKTQSIIDYYELGVREKENLVPPSFYLKNPKYKKTGWLEYLADKEQSEEASEFLKYADLKDDATHSLEVPNAQIYIDGINNSNIDHDRQTIGVGGSAVKDFTYFYLQNNIIPYSEMKIENLRTRFKGNNPIIIDKKQAHFQQLLTFSQNINACLPSYLKTEWENITEVVSVFGCCVPDNIRRNA